MEPTLVVLSCHHDRAEDGQNIAYPTTPNVPDRIIGHRGQRRVHLQDFTDHKNDPRGQNSNTLPRYLWVSLILSWETDLFMTGSRSARGR